MVQCASARLDSSFAALSDATRRGVLEQLGRADASITDLSIGRVRTCKLGLRHLEAEAAWIEKYRQLWGARFDALDKVVEELKLKEKRDGKQR